MTSTPKPSADGRPDEAGRPHVSRAARRRTAATAARSRPACAGCACTCPGRWRTSTSTRWPTTAAGRSSTPARRRARRSPTGHARSPPRTRWRGQRITRVFVTHMHPDHVGMAGWLTRRFDARLWMTRLEYLTCRTLVADTGREAPDDAMRFYKRAGWDDEAIEHYRVRFGSFGRVVHTLPDSFRRLHDGERLAHRRARVARDRRQRPLARARLPAQRRAEAADLGRPGAAAHLVERVGVPHRARGRPAGRLDRVDRRSCAPRCPTTCWCCRRTASRSAACTRGSTASHRATRRASRGCAARWPNRSARSTCSARCSRGRSKAPSCSAWPPARAWRT